MVSTRYLHVGGSPIESLQVDQILRVVERPNELPQLHTLDGFGVLLNVSRYAVQCSFVLLHAGIMRTAERATRKIKLSVTICMNPYRSRPKISAAGALHNCKGASEVDAIPRRRRACVRSIELEKNAIQRDQKLDEL